MARMSRSRPPGGQAERQQARECWLRGYLRGWYAPCSAQRVSTDSWLRRASRPGLVALALLAAVGVAGCLVPPDVMMDPQNHPPRISGPVLPTSTLVRIDRDCKNEVFEILEIEDPDVDDTLYMRWIIDVQGQMFLLQPDKIIVPPERTEFRSTVRDGDSFDLLVRDNAITPGIDNTHATLRFIVSDRPFDDEAGSSFSATVEGALTDRKEWVLYYVDGNGICPTDGALTWDPRDGEGN
jgi:hypothetical protein